MFLLIVRIGIVWLSVLLAVLTVAAARHASGVTRILFVDLLALLLVGLLALVGFVRNSTAYLDGALALALVGLAGTVAAAQYLRRGRVW